MESDTNPLTKTGRIAWARYLQRFSSEVNQQEYAEMLTMAPDSTAVCCLCEQVAALVAESVCLRCAKNCLQR
jgi:hypothetical protein